MSSSTRQHKQGPACCVNLFAPPPCRHTVASSVEDGIKSIVSELDRAGMGPAQPTHPHKPPPQPSPSRGSTTPRGGAWGSADGTPVAEHAMEAGNVEVGGVRSGFRDMFGLCRCLSMAVAVHTVETGNVEVGGV